MKSVSVLGSFRATVRSLQLLVFLAVRITSRWLAVAFSSRRRTRCDRAQWLQQTAEGCRRIFRLRIEQASALPTSGLLVANHLSYLDIVLLASLRPCVFVSKREVRSWPIFGTCAQLGGTIFVDRTRRGAVGEVSEQMRAALAEGLLLVLFPEGTSSGGAGVLPFKSALLEPALRLGCEVSVAALGYRLPGGGSVAEEVCYWGEMTLLPHLLRVLSKREIVCRVQCGTARARTGDRKTLATEWQQETADLYRALWRPE